MVYLNNDKLWVCHKVTLDTFHTFIIITTNKFCYDYNNFFLILYNTT